VRRELRDWLRRLHDEVHVTTVFVTHDQEEALEVSDEIVVINHSRIEQVGTPADLYDKPSNDFVMEFLGPVTTPHGRLVRPHDVEIFAEQVDHSVAASVTRMQRIGFEVRAELDTGAEQPWAQLTRGQAELLELAPGSRVWVRSLD
jgi:sulfate/thiosulfate transport system ATP-binding protein